MQLRHRNQGKRSSKLHGPVTIATNYIALTNDYSISECPDYLQVAFVPCPTHSHGLAMDTYWNINVTPFAHDNMFFDKAEINVFMFVIRPNIITILLPARVHDIVVHKRHMCRRQSQKYYIPYRKHVVGYKESNGKHWLSST